MKDNKELKQILLDPTMFYKKPDEVLSDNSLSKEQKLEVLKRWEYDAKELEVADDENMAASNNGANILDEVLEAIKKLNTN